MMGKERREVDETSLLLLYALSPACGLGFSFSLFRVFTCRGQTGTVRSSLGPRQQKLTTCLPWHRPCCRQFTIAVVPGLAPATLRRALATRELGRWTVDGRPMSMHRRRSPPWSSTQRPQQRMEQSHGELWTCRTWRCVPNFPCLPCLLSTPCCRRLATCSPWGREALGPSRCNAGG